MNLEELIFKADTTQLKQASDVIDALAVSMDKVTKAERDRANIEAKQAKAAKDSAQAQEALASANEKQAKATATAEAAERKRTKALADANGESKKRIDVLQRERDATAFMAEGYSRADSKFFATAKQAGILNEELIQLRETQRSMGPNPFDQSDVSIKRLSRSYREANEAQSLFADGVGLTVKQARDLSKDLDRVALRMTNQGKSLDEITNAQATYRAEYIKLANDYNRVASAEQAVIKQRKEVVSASNYVIEADKRMAAALNVSNAGFSKAATDDLVKYETALRKSGIAQDLLTTKLDTYKKQLSQVQAQENKAREQHLARALSPQLTDIAVSLYSGQSPLTVLMQQGGQIADLLRLSGVAAENFSKSMKNAFASMIPVMATVAKGVGELALSLVADVGRSFTGFVGGILGITSAVETAKRAMVAGGEENFKYIGTLTRIGEISSAVAGGIIAGLVATFIAVAVASKQVNEATNKMNTNLVSHGALVGATTTELYNLAKSAKDTGSSFVGVLNAFSEIAKVGNIPKDAFVGIAEAALQLESVGGESVKKTVEMFSKLGEKPIETLIKYTEQTGLISTAELERVNSLVKLGKETTATAEATDILAKAVKEEAALMYASATPLSRLWIDIKAGILGAWGAVQQFAGTDAIIKPVTVVLQTVAVVATEVWFAVRGIGESLGGLGALAAAVMTDIKNLDTKFTASKSVLGAIKEGDDARKASYEDTVARIMQTGKYSEEEQQKELARLAQIRQANALAAKDLENHEKVMKDYRAAAAKDQIDTLSRSAYIAKQQEEAQKKLREGVTLPQQDLNLIATVAGKDWDEKHKKSQNAAESFYNSIMKSATNAGIQVEGANAEMTKSQIQLLETMSNPKWNTLSEVQQQNYLDTIKASIATEQQAKLVKNLSDAEEFRLSVLGKSDGIGKQYYAQIDALEKYAKIAGWSREQVEQLTLAIYKSTPAYKAYQKAINDASSAADKYNAQINDQIEKSNAEISNLDLRIELLGKTEDQQKALTLAYERNNKVIKANSDLNKTLLRIQQDLNKAKAAGLTESDASVQALLKQQEHAYEAHRNALEVIDKEYMVRQMEERQKEIDRISKGLSDAFATGIFEGGAAGATKLKDFLKTEFKNYIIKVFIQPVMQGLVGGLFGMLGMGGGSAGGISGVGGGALGLVSNASNAYSGYNLLSGGLFASPAAYGAMVPGLSMGGQQAAMLAEQTGVFGVQGATATAQAGGAGAGGFGAIFSSPVFWGAAAVGLGAAFGLFRGTEKRGDVLTGTLGKDKGIHSGDLMRKDGYLFGGPDWFVNDTGVSGTDKAIQAQWADSLKSIKAWTEALGLSTDKIDGFTTTLGSEKLGDHGQLGIRLDNNGQPLSAQEVQAKINEAIRTGNNELAQQIIGTLETTTKEVSKQVFRSGFEAFDSGKGGMQTVTETVTSQTYKPSEFARDGEKAIDTLQRLGVSIINVNGAFETMNMALLDASLAGADAASKFIDMFGGLDKFNAAAASYYQNFYSGSERLAKAREDQTKKLKENGINIDLSDPGARAKYRAEVDKNQALMVEQEKNKANLRKSFDERFSGLDGKTLTDMGGSGWADDKIKKELLGDLKLTDDESTRLNGLFDSFDKGKMSVEDFKKGIIDFGESVVGSGKSAEDTTAFLLQNADAFAAVTAALPDLSQTAGDLANIIKDGMLGNFKGDDIGSAMAQTVTDGIYSAIAGSFAQQISNIIVAGVVEPIVTAAVTGAAITGAVSAATIDAMVAQATAVAEAAAKILSDPLFIEGLKKVNDAVSKIKIPVMRAVPAVQSYNKAVDSSAKATQDSAKKITSAWADITKSLMDQVEKIRGLIQEDAGKSFEYLQSQFAITTAMARSGDVEAAKKLVSLSDALLQAGALQAGSLIELQSLRADVAGSLQTTAGYAQGYANGQPVISPVSSSIAPLTLSPAQTGQSSVVVVQTDPKVLDQLVVLTNEQRAQAGEIIRLSTRITRVAEKWDADGLPATRSDAVLP